MAASRTRILLWSSLGGLLWALAWPAIGGITPLAFVAWLPLLHAERLHDARTAGRRVAFTPYVFPALFIWNAACSWWFFLVSEPLATRVVSVSAPVLVNTLLMAIPWWLRRVVRRRMGIRAANAGFVLFWLAFERLHHGWDLQWPWFSIGNVFGGHPEWVQWYDHTGMLGGSLWVLLVTLLADRATVACCAFAKPSAKQGRQRAGCRAVMRPVAAAFLLLTVPLGISLARYHGHVEEGVPVEVVVVQPNVDPYSEKFGGVDALEQLDRMLGRAEEVMGPDTRLVIFPETALQEHSTVELETSRPVLHGLWENDPGVSRSAGRIRTFQGTHPGVAVLSGMSSYYLVPEDAPKPPAARPLGGSGRWYQASNAALFMPGDGPVGHYRKSKLVAGVERMPFEQVLGRLDHLALDLGGIVGSLAQQDERTVFHDPASGIRAIPVICYESVFGEHVAAHVRNGGNLIALITNDGWWGRSPGFRQHLTFARLRAIETRRAVARSANTGISCFVDQRGAIREATAWWEPDARRSQVFLNDRITPFVRYGDVIGRSAVALSALLLAVTLFVAWRRRSGRDVIGSRGSLRPL